MGNVYNTGDVPVYVRTGGALGVVTRSSCYIGPASTTASTASPNNTDGRFSPLWLPPCTIDRIGLKVTSASNGAGDAARTVNDGVTNTTTTITSATAAFVATDVGRLVTGSGIPVNTYIASITNGTTAVITKAATASASSVSITISGSVIRLGIYQDTGSAVPGSLLLDAGLSGSGALSSSGILDATSATYQEATVSLVHGGGLLWLVSVTQGVKTTVPTVRASTGVQLPAQPIENSGAGASDNVDVGIIGTALATVGLPAAAGSPVAIGATSPRVVVRTA